MQPFFNLNKYFLIWQLHLTPPISSYQGNPIWGVESSSFISVVIIPKVTFYFVAFECFFKFKCEASEVSETTMTFRAGSASLPLTGTIWLLTTELLYTKWWSSLIYLDMPAKAHLPCRFKGMLLLAGFAVTSTNTDGVLEAESAFIPEVWYLSWEIRLGEMDQRVLKSADIWVKLAVLLHIRRSHPARRKHFICVRLPQPRPLTDGKKVTLYLHHPNCGNTKRQTNKQAKVSLCQSQVCPWTKVGHHDDL